jgi:hypothetical protein
MFSSILLCLAAAAFLGWGMYRAFETPEQASWRTYRDWERKRRAEGAASEDIHAEAHLREQLAQLREACSVHVMTAPDGPATWETELKRKIESSAHVLSVLDPGLAKRYVRLVSELRHADILYPAAYEIVHPRPKTEPVSAESMAHLARIRTAAFTDL